LGPIKKKKKKKKKLREPHISVWRAHERARRRRCRGRGRGRGGFFFFFFSSFAPTMGWPVETPAAGRFSVPVAATGSGLAMAGQKRLSPFSALVVVVVASQTFGPFHVPEMF
jgi:hypothetical protein